MVPVTETPTPGKIRDINTYTLTGMVKACGAIPVSYGIVRDNKEILNQTLSLALKTSDMVLVSGGSSVGVRDVTIDAHFSAARASYSVSWHLDQSGKTHHSGHVAK